MDRTYIIEIPIYREELHVFFGPIEECEKAIREDGVEEVNIRDWKKDNENCLASFTESDSGYLLLWLNNLPETIRDYSDLIHEIEHVVFSVLDYRGVIHSSDSDEAFAYLSGWLYEQIEEFIQDEKSRSIFHQVRPEEK